MSQEREPVQDSASNVRMVARSSATPPGRVVPSRQRSNASRLASTQGGIFGSAFAQPVRSRDKRRVPIMRDHLILIRLDRLPINDERILRLRHPRAPHERRHIKRVAHVGQVVETRPPPDEEPRNEPEERINHDQQPPPPTPRPLQQPQRRKQPARQPNPPPRRGRHDPAPPSPIPRSSPRTSLTASKSIAKGVIRILSDSRAKAIDTRRSMGTSSHRTNRLAS